MSTESTDERFINLDKWPTINAVENMIEGQFSAISAVMAAKHDIAKAVDASYERLKSGKGRLIYVGAGTSGRVAVQDGVELHPTYGWPWERLVFAMAGGDRALMQAVENAEDDYDAGFQAMLSCSANQDDVIIGVAASGRTPFTLGAIHAGKQNNCLTIGFANNPNTALIDNSEIGIFLDSGAEPIAGSTRMKAGTSQKVALNIYSTALMVNLGGVYKGLMVGMKATNQKLRNRATRIIMSLTNAEEKTARDAVSQSQGDLKIAVLIALGINDKIERDELIEKAQGNLRSALKFLM